MTKARVRVNQMPSLGLGGTCIPPGLCGPLEGLRAACDLEGVQMAEASIRWVLHHSVLSGKHHDGIIFGASSLAHAEANLAACSKGPLP